MQAAQCSAECSITLRCSACRQLQQLGVWLLCANQPSPLHKYSHAGVRNTVGFDWHPVTKQLYFTDNGRDSKPCVRAGDPPPTHTDTTTTTPLIVLYSSADLPAEWYAVLPTCLLNGMPFCRPACCMKVGQAYNAPIAAI